MKIVSTTGNKQTVSFKEAVLSNMPADKGLFLPNAFRSLDPDWLTKVDGKNFAQTAFIVLQHLLEQEISDTDLLSVCKRAFNFEMPLVELEEGMYVLETFHGPSGAFKDVGVRFLAEVLQYYNIKNRLILTATSGDTGAAVAAAFSTVPEIKVCILYPKGRVSSFQEKQIAGFGGNITALCVEGDFDQCQAMIKSACNNSLICSRLVSANSINIARLLAQVAYYAHLYAQLKPRSEPASLTISVPSGNFGNVTAALIAKKIGIPISHLIAATNSNDVIPKYLETGLMTVQPTVETLSTAMDIALPNNFERVQSLFSRDIERLRSELNSFSVSDEETKNGMRQLYEKYSYVCDPHGAVAYAALKKTPRLANESQVFLATAHPVKFFDTVFDALNVKAEIPSWLMGVEERAATYQVIAPKGENLTNILQGILQASCKWDGY